MGTGIATAERDPKAEELAEEEIVERIFEAVIDQRLPPGMKLSEAALCEAFGVGRMRIRQSLLLLSSREVVELQPNRGAFVASPSAEQAREVFETRLMIEPNVARLAAERATPADIARQAKRAGLPIHVQPAHFPTNAAPASYAIIAAQKAAAETGSGDLPGLVEAVLRACWAEQKNIAEDAVITAALEAAGFDPGLAMSGLFTGAETYGRNLEEAVVAGVFGAPSFVTEDGAVFWGQDRLDDLADHLDGAG